MFFYLDQRRELSFFSTCFFFPFVVVVVVVVLLLLLLLLFFFFVELCRPVLYDVRTQSSFIAGGGGEYRRGGRGRSEHFGGIIWFSGGMDGDQWSLTDFKGGYTKLTANGAGSLKYYRDLWGYSGSFYCDMTNNPPSSSSSPSPSPPSPSC